MRMTSLETVLRGGLAFNPCVAVRDLRSRMRGTRAFILILTYALFACGTVVVVLCFLSLRAWVPYSPGHLASLPSSGHWSSSYMGRSSFAILGLAQMVLIVLVVPATSAGAIAMEREKRTLEMLRGTLLTSFDVVTGKLVVVVAFAGLLLVTSLPVAMWCVMLGGVSPAEVLIVYAYLFGVAVLLAAFGLVCSTRSRSALGATSIAYVTTAVVLVGGPGLKLLLDELHRWRSGFGPDAAALMTVLVPLGLSIPVFIVGRWTIARVFSWGKTVRGLAVSAGTALLVLYVLANLMMDTLLNAAMYRGLATLVAVHPFFAMADLMAGTGPGDTELTGWVAPMAVAWITGLTLWFLAIVAYDKSARRD